MTTTYAEIIEGWERTVKRLKQELEMNAQYVCAPYDPRRSEFRIYALCLGQARERSDRTRDMENPQRQSAWREYVDAFQRENEIYEEGNGGAAIGSVTVGRPVLPELWEERMFQAQQVTDEALLRWCAE